MKRLRKFFRLPATERRLLIQAALLLGIVRLGLVLLPFLTLQNILTHIARLPRLPKANRVSPDQLAWAISMASQHIVGAKTCLIQALAAQTLLARYGYPAHLRLGVAKGDNGQLQAHAWVESNGKVVIGDLDEELAHYARLSTLDGERA
jgi:hypothetical protein